MLPRRVSQEKFYENIGPMDVTVTVVGNYPYRTDFKTRRNRDLAGYVQDYGTNKKSEYYLMEG